MLASGLRFLATGQRVETLGAREDLGVPASFFADGRWTHGLARSPGGQLYLSRGAYGSCGGAPGGEIGRIGVGVVDSVAKGFRNPMYMRCHRTDEVCVATELGEDQTPGAREKLVFLRSGTDYGYPCCFSTALPTTSAVADACGQVCCELMPLPHAAGAALPAFRSSSRFSFPFSFPFHSLHPAR